MITAVPIPDDEHDDPEWWDLDSSESIPATMARPGRGAAVALASRPASALSTRSLSGLPERSASAVKPQDSKWLTYVGISVGGIVGVILLVIVLSLASGSRSPQPKAVADQPASEATAAPAPVAEEKSEPAPAPAPIRTASGPEAHRAAIVDLTRAYHEIADGYLDVNGPASIPRAEGRIARGVEQLKAAAERGRSLPPLQPSEHAALTASTGPSLLQAVDRVIQQLRRLKANPGIKSDFDRLIDAYTRARQAIEREMQGPGITQPQAPNFSRPPIPAPPRIAPPRPPRGFRGRR
ncbi:MAG: hypothetical protein ACLQGP_24640 [Isosphaeraceae bacterium]